MRKHLFVACGLVLLVVTLACRPAPEAQTPYAEVIHRLTQLIEAEMAHNSPLFPCVRARGEGYKAATNSSSGSMVAMSTASSAVSALL